jgi:hypothetical protein
MELEITKFKNPFGTLIILLGLSIMPINQNAYAESIEEVCERPTFKFWKQQQAIRLWSPNEETLSAERSGKLFTYNCFTFEEIDQFFTSHEDRIENAHFYPILEIKRQKGAGSSDNDDDC